MARKDRLPHIFVPDNRTQTREYSYPKPVVIPTTIPVRVPGTHGAKLKADLAKVVAATAGIDAARTAAGVSTERGMILVFEIEPGLELALDKLDRRRDGIELLSVRDKAGVVVAAVFVPEGKLQALEKLIEQYRTETVNRTGNPKNELLGASVRAIRRAVVEELWTDDEPLPAANQPIWWEVWLRLGLTAVSDFKDLARVQQVEVGDQALVFVDRIVVLARGTIEQMSESVELLDGLAELRKAKELASFFTTMTPREQGDWVKDLARTIVHPGADAMAVCILDTGVNRGHPLLEPLMAPDDMHAVDLAWGTSDHRGHGTEMAGLAAWGDLTAALAGYPPSPPYVLESVVLLNPAWMPGTPPELYGSYTASAVALPMITAPDRDRVFCMTVTTTDFRDRGKPSSWSAEVDTLVQGRRDDLPRLMVISAGNIWPEDRWKDYPALNDLEQVHDPGQAWNAITVGAYTDKVTLDAAAFPAHIPLAQAGALSPSSVTSVTWASPWPIKPEIVMEGGNASLVPSGEIALPDDLRLLTTNWKPTQKLLVETGDTSGAAALASGFAATLWAQLVGDQGYDDLWPETLRALTVHSARWKKGMLDTLPAGTQRQQRTVLLRRYGWGVPALDRATWSATNALTLVAQRSIQPFGNVADAGKAPKVKTKDWHLYELPWPTDALQNLGNMPVELRVTLSYYVEPNPARRGWRTRHRYQSAGLRFAVKRAEESIGDFRARVSKNDQDEDEGLPSFSEPEWFLGPAIRDKGSVHSDIWRGPAVNLAARGHLAVFPVGGWWKERVGAQRYDDEMRYSLVVSIHVPDETVDIYTPVAVSVGVPVEIET